MTADLLRTAAADLRDIQPPLIAAMLIGACITKLARVRRTGTQATGSGPAGLFPPRLRRRLTVALCAAELSLGTALVVTLLPAGTRTGMPLFAPRAATGARVAAAAFFVVAAAALLELRGRRPDLGCGCFGELSGRPAGVRPIARCAVLTVAALISLETPALYLPPRGRGALLFLGLLCAELALIAALSPEVSEGLIRLGYADPCELRIIPTGRTLAALHRSRAWRRHARAITSELPIDMWRELCWRYVVFPYREEDGAAENEGAGAGDEGGAAEVVFAVQMKRRRPAVRVAVVPLATGETAPTAEPVPHDRGAARGAIRLSTHV